MASPAVLTGGLYVANRYVASKVIDQGIYGYAFEGIVAQQRD